MQRNDAWMTTEEAAAYLKVHPVTLRNWARQGAIASVKLGNRGGFRFKREDLDQFLGARRRGGP
jgi:excisionase family DNA binding protein